MLSDFEQELLNVSSQVDEYLDKNQFKDVFCPDEILHSSFHYLELGGKRLRPAVTLFSCVFWLFCVLFCFCVCVCVCFCVLLFVFLSLLFVR